MADAAAAEGPTTDAAAPASEAHPVVTFAKKQRRGNIRKRPQAEEPEAAQLATEPAELPSAVRKTKAAKADNRLAFSTKRPEEEKVEPFTFESSRTLQQSTDNRATATLETETAFDRDARHVPLSFL